MGRLLQTIGALQAAQQNFDAALQADIARVDVSLNDPNAHGTLGYLFARLDRPDEALAEFALALTMTPAAPDLHVAMSQVHLQRGDFTPAAEAARRAIALNPSHKQAHYSLATALMRLGKPEEAKPEFDAFERLQSEDTASASQQMKINGLKRALELDPDNPDLRKQLEAADKR
jgi:tetratricopeptide (TPR) repeat protein